MGGIIDNRVLKFAWHWLTTLTIPMDWVHAEPRSGLPSRSHWFCFIVIAFYGFMTAWQAKRPTTLAPEL